MDTKQWTLVNFCEFDPYAVKSYCAVHNEEETKNLGDITKVDETTLQPFNMICGGSPCQDFSVAGDKKGSVWECQDCKAKYNPLTVHWSKREVCPICGSTNLDKSRSSLLVEFLRIVRANKPTFGIYENVKNIIGKQFLTTTFKLFEEELHEYGYNTYWKVLNAKNYGIPQNRERVYLIFIQKDKDNGKFTFPEGFDNGIRLKDLLESNVDEKFYLPDEIAQSLITTINEKAVNTANEISMLGLLDIKGNEQVRRVYGVEGIAPTLNTMAGGNRQPKVLFKAVEPFVVASRGRYLEPSSDCTTGTPTEQRLEPNFTGCSNTITTVQKDNYVCEPKLEVIGNCNPSGKGMNGLRIRKLTPKECWRLMGFDDSDFEKAEMQVSNSQLYKQAGNSIVVDVLYYIYKELYKAMPYLFDDLKLCSLFSGIGAFEVALNRLYEYINSEDVTDFSDAPEEIKEQILANAAALEKVEEKTKIITLESFSNEELLAELQRRMTANKEEVKI